MKHRVLWSTIAAIAVGHIVVVLVVLAALWAMNAPAAVETAPAPPPRHSDEQAPPPSLAVQRLAELFASAAFRSVITFDYAALKDLVTRASAWPEVIYVSVEDAQGKIIAHTDRARIGHAWDPVLARESAASRGAHQEASAAMSAPEDPGKPGPSLGRVRLGYLVGEPRSVAPPVASPRPMTRGPIAWLPLLVILAGAALAAIPVGFGLVALGGVAAASSDVPVGDLKKIHNLKQARWVIAHWVSEAERLRTQLAAHQGEAQRLKDGLAERTSHLAQAAVESERLLGERARWLAERERLMAELGDRRRELADARSSAQECAGEAEEGRRGRARLEAEVMDLRDEVQEARAALAGASIPSREPLEQEVRQHQRRAVAYISHAIRSSLTNVLGFSKLLLRASDGPLNEGQHTSVLHIHEAGNHLLRVVNDLSELTQVEAGTLELHADEIIDVASVLREVAATSASALARDPEAIIVDCPLALPPARGNERRLVQILLALMHPPTPDADGPIELSARADEKSVTLTVAHRAATIASQDLPALLDPFLPIDAASSLQDDGGRLRLALARALVTMTGGHLAVDSREAAGTTFTVTLPVLADVPAVA